MKLKDEYLLFSSEVTFTIPVHVTTSPGTQLSTNKTVFLFKNKFYRKIIDK